ncbi:sulfatase domain-containing protein [Massilia sp. WF1]|uniref:phosphoethanolamine transferase n=1 Tax=unclassified Massilia TaxID=2609279 RepID=UPI00068C191E|nr:MULTISPECIES: phosphoethanolamine transferase [unclassified Massilia]ALK99313.1 sulfatase domain-containing protein [Massilia sp. WG5]KNZ67575.1 sulfatase domain-containing protein [Massilia sp. WF1]
MRSLLRPRNLYVLLSYLVLSSLPFAPWLFGHPVAHPSQLLGVELICWIGIWAFCKRPACFHWLLLPAFLGVPMELYLYAFYGQGISTHHLGIIAETSPAEAMEFLGSKVWLLAGAFIGVVVWFITTWIAAWRTRDLDWDDVSRTVVMGVLGLGVAVFGYGHHYGIAPPPPALASAAKVVPIKTGGVASPSASAAEQTAAPRPGSLPPAGRLPPLAHWAKLPLDLDAFSRSWPFGLLARGFDFYQERVYLADLNERSAHFHFGAHAARPRSEPQLVVMVIGESSRYDRWSLNGYARDTNPLLSQETNLVTLPDMITSVSATRLSVPVIISRKPAMQSLHDGFSEKSFLTAFKEAGFKTFWLSNQMSFGKFDTPVSVFAKEADVVDFLNLGGYTNNSNYDEVLFGPLKHAMADPAPKKLIVLHTLGSHWNYSHRYPKQFDKWLPSLYGVDKPAYTDLRIKAQLNNSYDSSILYTDWFLAHVIDSLRDTGLPASMLYVADHGQTLYDNSCRLAFHGHNTQYEFHIPALAWYSDAYRERYPDKVEQLLKHSKAKLATENMFHTLLDMAEVRYPGERLEWSFVNSGFKQHRRYVDSYGWTDYDRATIQGDCHEVIAKGKPVPRS